MASEAGGTARFEVTATRRRPRTFDELAGQEFVVSTLKNSLNSRTIAHAYLFSGPRGCGKTSAARIMARSLNCREGPAANPCGVCPNCREIAAGASLDVIEIDGASNTSVNDVRQIKDEVLFPPQSGRYKVYIIDEVHMLSTSAFNALLKTIEEPPPYIVFIFATTELHKVPATIKSRCQQFAFRLIPIETIKAILRDVCDEMKIEAEDEALFWMARESTGSLRDAFTLFDQVASFSAGRIRTELIREKLGLVGLERLNELAEACAEGDLRGSLELLDGILGSGVAVEQFIIDMAGYYRSLLLLKNSVVRESLLGYPADRFSSRALDRLDSPRLEQALELLLDCYRDIRYSVSPRFEVETLVSKLSWLKDWIPPAELRAAVEEARRALGGGGLERRPEAADYPPEAPPPRPSPPQEAGSGTSLSQEFLRRVAARESQGPQEGRAGFVEADRQDDDAPPWSGRQAGGGGRRDAQVQQVLRIFRGTVVSEGNAVSERNAGSAGSAGSERSTGSRF
jgi:DNA polymerase-3 subunit gamma/tau